jgi:uncharacterized alpha/beta hydrolase family protein
MSIKANPMQVYVDKMLDYFEGEGAVNYLEQTFGCVDNPDKDFVITMQMVNGKTPCETIAQLQDQVDNLKKELRERAPMQPIINGRFKENKIVSYCLDNKTNMNDIAMQDFTVEDRQQFAQLIGYSLGGFSTLSYVTDECYDRVESLNNIF